MKNITQAIIKVMKKVEGIDKSMIVGTGSNKYKGVSDKDVRMKIGKAMRENGLCIVPVSIEPNIQVDRWEETSNFGTKTKQSIFTEVKTKYLLLHESGESIEVAGYGHGVDTQDKGAGKATTYALKNTLLAVFLVPTGVEDTDETHSEDLPIPQKKTKPANFDERTPQQQRTIKKLMIETKTPLEKMYEYAGITEGTILTKEQASKVITWLNGILDARGEIN
jgi:hypothetical protein